MLRVLAGQRDGGKVNLRAPVPDPAQSAFPPCDGEKPCEEWGEPFTMGRQERRTRERFCSPKCRYRHPGPPSVRARP
jgi:hypothetical protein